MERNENTGSVPDHPEKGSVVTDDDSSEQPTTLAGGGLGPLETAIEKSEESED